MYSYNINLPTNRGNRIHKKMVATTEFTAGFRTFTSLPLVEPHCTLVYRLEYFQPKDLNVLLYYYGITLLSEMI